MSLVALDTNVLVRYLVADDPIQGPIARNLIDKPESGVEKLLITVPVLCELTWLLRSRRYGFGRQRVADALCALLDSDRFQVQSRAQVVSAVSDFRRGPSGLADHLILHLSYKEGAREVVTFDRDFALAAGVRDLGAESR